MCRQKILPLPQSGFWKARRPMLTTPNTQLVVASWKAGEPKQVLSCLSPTRPCSLLCSRVSWLLPRHYPVNSPASRPGPFPLQTGGRALTHWVCQEEVLRWLTAACIPDAGGDCFSTEQSNKKGQLRWNKLITQTICSGLRAQLQDPQPTSPSSSLDPTLELLSAATVAKAYRETKRLHVARPRRRHDAWSNVTPKQRASVSPVSKTCINS